MTGNKLEWLKPATYTTKKVEKNDNIKNYKNTKFVSIYRQILLDISCLLS
jgi:hypothetical protein